MVYRGVYAAVLVLHLLSVVFIIGPLVVASTTSPQLLRGGREGLAALRASARLTRVNGLGALLVVVLGTAMIGLGDVGDSWSFSQLWVSGSYLLVLVALVLTLAVVVPAQQRGAAALETGQDASAYAGRVAAGARIAALAWIAVIALMVLKPGA